MTSPAERAPVEDPTVLVVDDDRALAETYALWLEERYETRVATSGAEALDVVDEAVDVALLDRRIPRLSGDWVLERIREEGPDVSVAMVTAVEPESEVAEMEFEAYLGKPVDRADLVETVEDLLAVAAWDERVRELFAVSTKLGLLGEGRGDEEAVAALRERRAELERDLAEALEEVDDECRLFRAVERVRE